jgi:hypothetical protein
VAVRPCEPPHLPLLPPKYPVIPSVSEESSSLRNESPLLPISPQNRHVIPSVSEQSPYLITPFPTFPHRGRSQPFPLGGNGKGGYLERKLIALSYLITTVI